MPQKVRKAVTSIGPKNNPVKPYNLIPPKVLKRIKRKGIRDLDPIKAGFKTWSESPDTRMPHKRRNIPIPVLWFINQRAAGTVIKTEAPNKAKTAAAKPKKNDRGIPATKKPAVSASPTARAVTKTPAATARNVP